MHNQNPNSQISPQTGLVISYFGNSVAVEADHGQVFQCHLHRNQDLPVVGDHVHWQMGDDHTGVILEILPRKTLLSRGDDHGKSKAIAANIDILAIVMAPPPIFSEYLVDRYLVAAELLAIKPVIVMNKVDLLQEGQFAAANQRLEVYRQIGYTVILSSIYQENGLQSLAEALHGKTAVLVGPSGVGKSSLISALGAEAPIRVGEVSAKGTGKHTTTATTLYHLPTGGNLIDSPGVREFNLWPVEKKDVWRGFKEFHQFANHCQFRDCQHLADKGCSLQIALTNGEVSRERFTSYQQLMKIAAAYKKY